MAEELVSKCAVVVVALWVAVGLFAVSGWAAMFLAPDGWRWAVMLATTACATSAVAAVFHIKLYVTRVCSLIRAASGLDSSEGLRLMR